MAQARELRVSGNVKLDATGGGQVQVSAPGGVDWTVTRVSIRVSSNVKEPVFRLYRGAVSDSEFLEGSYSGSQDSSDSVHELQAAQPLIGVWTGGDVGATATMSVSGRAGGS